MDASQRIKEEAEAKLKREMEEANREDESRTANNIAERTRKLREVRHDLEEREKTCEEGETRMQCVKRI